jgi:hypothetical protein
MGMVSLAAVAAAEAKDLPGAAFLKDIQTTIAQLAASKPKP